MSKGFLICNLGTPREATPKEVGRFLDEFLMDPYVIDLPYFFRLLLVRGIIVPFRSKRSSEAYSKIWTKAGSPLKVISEEMTNELRLNNPDSKFYLAMRYGSPSIPDVLSEMKEGGITEIRALSLYPQFSRSTTQSIEERITDSLKKLDWSPKLRFVDPFFKDDGFVDSWAKTIQAVSNPDSHILLSFHGLPKKQVQKYADPYPKQCIETADAIQMKLGFDSSRVSMSYQSRLGRAEWLTPYTEEKVKELAASGVKDLVVACPSFVTDCLETLEEIGIGIRETYLKAGGVRFAMAACPNANEPWVRTAQRMLNDVPGP